MKNIIIETAVAAALTLTGFAAHAGCADPRTASQQAMVPMIRALELEPQGAITGNPNANAAAAIVGTWQVTYTVEGAPFAQAFIQWHRDGTEWENIGLPVLGGTLCMGSWKAVDATHVSRNHIGWLYTNGVLTGYFTETETDAVAANGLSYSGTNDQKIYDLNGVLQVEVTGTAMATRLSR